uniref:Immunoglobulin V-set domain-containing protein n=1 Tax=Cyprinus carpio TaxID=7962 RepID=A0A8C1T4C8_CYPCA
MYPYDWFCGPGSHLITVLFPIWFYTVSVMEGDSVTLNTDVSVIREEDDILWNFGADNSLIAEISREKQIFSTYEDVPDGRFRDILKVDNQTGSLTITNITYKHAGVYKLDIIAVNTHTHCEHTPGAVGSHFYAAAPGEQLGVRCLAQGHLSHGIEGGERTVHAPHPQFLPARDSNSQPFDWESDSLTIRPRLP